MAIKWRSLAETPASPVSCACGGPRPWQNNPRTMGEYMMADCCSLMRPVRMVSVTTTGRVAPMARRRHLLSVGPQVVGQRCCAKHPGASGAEQNKGSSRPNGMASTSPHTTGRTQTRPSIPTLQAQARRVAPCPRRCDNPRTTAVDKQGRPPGGQRTPNDGRAQAGATQRCHKKAPVLMKRTAFPTASQLPATPTSNLCSASAASTLCHEPGANNTSRHTPIVKQPMRRPCHKTSPSGCAATLCLDACLNHPTTGVATTEQS